MARSARRGQVARAGPLLRLRTSAPLVPLWNWILFFPLPLKHLIQVVGYTETTTVLGDLLLLSGVGTAVNLHFPSERRAEGDAAGPGTAQQAVSPPAKKKSRRRKCSFCHIPYSQTNPPFPMQLVLCLMCVPPPLYRVTSPASHIAH